MERTKLALSDKNLPCRNKPLLFEELESGLSFEVSLLSSLIRAPCTCGLTCFQMMSLRHHPSTSSHDCLSGSTCGARLGAAGLQGGSMSLAVAGGMCHRAQAEGQGWCGMQPSLLQL